MKQNKTIQRACQVLRSRVHLQNAHLTLPGNHWTSDDTPAIREATKLYVESWIDPLLDMIEQGNTRALENFIACAPSEQMRSEP